MSKKEVQTIADIARLAGVSKSTVSRALSDSPLIGEETKKRIHAIAKQHDFQINVPARRLSMKQSNTVAFVTHTYHKQFSVADLFTLEILGGITEVLHQNGYDLLMVHVDPCDSAWAVQHLETGKRQNQPGPLQGEHRCDTERHHHHTDIKAHDAPPGERAVGPDDKPARSLKIIKIPCDQGVIS